MTEQVNQGAAAQATVATCAADSAQVTAILQDKPFSPYASYPEGQAALLKQIEKNVPMAMPFKILPWGSLKKSFMPLLVKILIDG